MDAPAHDHRPHAGAPPGGAAGSPTAGDLIDPVCGMRVGPDAPDSTTHLGTLYRFCSLRTPRV